MLRLRLLGPVQVDVAGTPLRVDTRKAVAVLALVALDGTRARESLAAMLWPDSDQSHARSALRRTLSVLRRALDGRWLDADRDLVRLTGAWEADAIHLRQAVADTAAHGHAPDRPCPSCTATLTSAVEQVRGEFLSGFALRDSAPFDAWQTLAGEALRRDHGIALARLAIGLTATGRLRDALGPADAHVRLDPLHEPAQRRLMLLLAWTGQRSEATRVYRELVAGLDRELGVRPLDETTNLYDAIIDDRLPPVPGGSGTAGQMPADVVTRPVAASRPTGDPRPPEARRPAGTLLPLVGRDHQLRRLHRAIDRAEESGFLVAIHGEPGAGKTRLVAEFLDQLEPRAHQVAIARCHPGDAGVAYAPVVAALRDAIDGVDDGWLDELPTAWRDEAARLVPELATTSHMATLEPLTSPGAQARFVDGIWNLLGAILGRTGPGILVVDDLHRADAASVGLLSYGSARLDQHGLVVITCWRDEELHADHPWRTTVADVAANGRALELDLPRLAPDQVRALVADVAPHADPAATTRLINETEGLPLALTAYLPELVEGTDPAAWRLPEGLKSLYAARVQALDDLPGQVLTAAAVIGRSFDLDTLTAVSGRAEEEVVDALDALAARGMVVEASGGHDFSHDKLRSVVLDGASLARRRLLHRRAADALRTQPDPDAAAVALHEQEAGRDERAADMHARAGERARDLFANADALAHLRQALALGHPEPAALHEAIGQLEMLEGNYARALSSLDTAAALADDPEAMAALECLAAAVYRRMGDPTSARVRLASALELLGPDGSLEARARLHAELALAHVQAGCLEAANQTARRTLELAEQTVDRQGVAQARNLLGMLARREGRLVDAQRHLELSTDLAARLPADGPHIAALNNLALVLRDAGHPDRAIEHASEAVRLCVRMGDRHHAAALHSNLADLLHATGRDDEARDHLTTSASLFAAVGREPQRAPEIWRLIDW